MSQPEFKVIKQFVEEKIAFVQRSGLKLLSIEEGIVTCMMPGSGNENHIGSMYAGALFTLAEIPGGVLWMANFNMSESYPILKSFRIEFLKPAKGDIVYSVGMSSDQVTELSALCRETGKAEFELVGELKDRSGAVVAKSFGLYQLRKH
jgi:acyl-coenzyme A thioesterase PaaI-like protein